MSYIYACAIGGLLWTARVHLQSVGREDAADYRKKMLDPRMIASASLFRAGQAALLPTALDTFTPWNTGIGNVRSSVAASPDAGSFFVGMPLTDFSKRLFQAYKFPAVASSSEEFQLSQTYMRNSLRLLPLSSLPYVTPVLNSIASQFPATTEQ